MGIVVGLSCLVMVVVLEGTIGFPDQQLVMEHQRQEYNGDQREVRRGDCETENTCMMVGGMCQAIDEPCDGELRVHEYLCKGRSCGCCIPPGCVYEDKAYPNNANFQVGCMTLTCKKGILTINKETTDSDCLAGSSGSCTCGFTLNLGCFLRAWKPANIACQCIPTGTIYDPRTYCRGHLVICAQPKSTACIEAGGSKANCYQGVKNGHGNCNGYSSGNFTEVLGCDYIIATAECVAQYGTNAIKVAECVAKKCL